MTQPTIPPNDGRVTTQVGTTPSTGPFQVDFPFMNLGEVMVQTLADGATDWTTLVYGTHYSVSAVPNEDGSYTNGTVTLVTAVANTQVSRFRNTFIQRLSNYPLTGYFDRLSLNAELNRYVMCLQDFQRRLVDLGGDTGGGGGGGGGDFPLVTRVLQTPIGEPPVDVSANPVATRASKILAWDVAGNLINSSVTLAQIEVVANAGVPDLTPYAPKASPVFTGNPTAPTPAAGDNSQSLANTSWVRALHASGPLGTAGGDLTGSYPNPVLASIVTAGSVGGAGQTVIITIDAKGRVTAASAQSITPGSIGAAPIASPALTGNPTTPDPGPTHQTDQTVANTKFVSDAVAAAVGGSTPTGPAGGDLLGSNYPNPLIRSSVTLAGSPTTTTPATSDNTTKIATTQFVKAQAYAPLADPVFTGNPTAPTPSAGDNDTSIATTAFVKTATAGMMYLHSEQLLAAPAAQVAVTIPASPKVIHLEFIAIHANAPADATWFLQAMQGGTPIATASYNYQNLAGFGTTVAASTTTAQGGWALSSAITVMGSLSVRPSSTSWYGNGTLAIYTSTTPRVAETIMFDTAAISGVTGFRIFNQGATNLAAGSYLRCLAVV
jgi:hypothetical protein